VCISSLSEIYSLGGFHSNSPNVVGCHHRCHILTHMTTYWLVLSHNSGHWGSMPTLPVCMAGSRVHDRE
jgi:hypothetical protein